MRNLGQTLNLKFLDNKPVDLGLPQEPERGHLFEAFSDPAQIQEKYPLPTYVVSDSRTGGTSINRGEVAVVEYNHPGGIDYHIVASSGIYRIDRGMKFSVGYSAALLGPFLLQGKECIEFGEQKQRLIQIFPGHMGFISFQGNVYPVDPGIYWLKSPYVQFLGSESLNKDEIKKQDFSIIRIPQGHFACYQDVDGNIKMLRSDENNSRFVLRRGQTFLGMHSNLEPSVVYGTDSRFQRVFLQPGNITFYTDEKGVTKYFEGAGEHILMAPSRFEIRRTESRNTVVLRKSTENFLKYGSIEIVNLRDGQIVFYIDQNGKTAFYDKPGRYELNAPAFFQKTADENTIAIHGTTDSYLRYGSIAILNLRQNEYAVKFDKTGKSELLKGPGKHIINLTEERIHEHANGNAIYSFLNQPTDKPWYENFGPFQFYNVPVGHAAIIVDSRRSENPTSISDNPGTYFLDDPLCRVQYIKSVRERRIDLGTHTDAERIFEASTNDRVRFKVKAYLLFKVTDPIKAYGLVENIEDVLRREAESLLVTLFGKHQAVEITQGVNTKISQKQSVSIDEVFQNKSSSFTAILMGEFTKEFEKFVNERGVQLTSMRVEELDFADNHMKNAMEKQAEDAQKLHVELQAIDNQRNLTLKKAAIAADGKKKEAEGTADAGNIAAAAAAQKMQTETNAAAGAIRAKAQAEAEAMLTIAKAEAEAARMKNGVQTELMNNPVMANAHLMKTYFDGLSSVMASAANGGTLIPTDLAIPAGVLQGNGGIMNFISQFSAVGNNGPQLFRVVGKDAQTPANNAQREETKETTLPY